jgi:hypothetical protein
VVVENDGVSSDGAVMHGGCPNNPQASADVAVSKIAAATINIFMVPSLFAGDQPARFSVRLSAYAHGNTRHHFAWQECHPPPSRPDNNVTG